MTIAAAKLASRAGQLDNRRAGVRTRRPLSAAIIICGAGACLILRNAGKLVRW
ncbi:MAG: hypothetical protein WBV25_03820 [Methylocella sp.]